MLLTGDRRPGWLDEKTGRATDPRFAEDLVLILPRAIPGSLFFHSFSLSRVIDTAPSFDVCLSMRIGGIWNVACCLFSKVTGTFEVPVT